MTWEVRHDGSLVQTAQPKLPADSYRIGKGVYFTNASGNSKKPSELGFMKAGKVVWQRPYTDVFGAGSSPGFGWAWDEEADALVGLGFRPSKEEATHDMTSGTLVSLEPATGNVLWSVPGVGYCSVSWDEHPEQVQLCAFKSGTITYKDSKATYSGVEGTLESRERVSGKVRWSVPLDAANYGTAWGDVPFRSQEGEAVRYSGGSVKRIDFTTGEAVEIPSNGVLACIESRPGFKIPDADESKVGRKHVSDISFPCGPDRTPKTQFSVAAVKDAGVKAGDLTVVLAKDGLKGYKLPA